VGRHTGYRTIPKRKSVRQEEKGVRFRIEDYEKLQQLRRGGERAKEPLLSRRQRRPTTAEEVGKEVVPGSTAHFWMSELAGQGRT